MSNTKEIIIAGGAAGTVAAIAGKEGAHVHLFEKNEVSKRYSLQARGAAM